MKSEKHLHMCFKHNVHNCIHISYDGLSEQEYLSITRDPELSGDIQCPFHIFSGDRGE